MSRSVWWTSYNGLENDTTFTILSVDHMARECKRGFYVEMGIYCLATMCMDAGFGGRLGPLEWFGFERMRGKP